MSQSDSASDVEIEEKEPDINALCLFCSEHIVLSKFALHCQKAHQFDFSAFVDRHDMDEYGFVRFVNYMRKEQLSADCLSRAESINWTDESFLRPTIADDELLMLDITEFKRQPSSNSHCGEPQTVLSQANAASLTLAADLQQENRRLQEQLVTVSELLRRTLQDIATMRSTMHSVMDVEEVSRSVPLASDSDEDHEDAYFGSYANCDIHQEMLSDEARMSAYQEAVQQNAEECIRGKRVLDLGCGTAILSVFCARAGAERVVGVEACSSMARCAAHIVEQNGLQSLVEIRAGRVEHVFHTDPPGGASFHVIVSEWMGYCLLYENMLESVLWARDRLLASNGVLLPNRCSMHLAAVSDSQRYTERVLFWDSVCGLQMGCMRERVVREASVEAAAPETLCVEEGVQLREFNLYTVSVGDLEFRVRFSLGPITRDCEMTALLVYFDALFDLKHAVTLSTSPLAPPTHWKHTLLYLPQPLKVVYGDTVEGSFTCCKQKSGDGRALKLIVHLDEWEEEQVYLLN